MPGDLNNDVGKLLFVHIWVSGDSPPRHATRDW